MPWLKPPSRGNRIDMRGVNDPRIQLDRYHEVAGISTPMRPCGWQSPMPRARVPGPHGGRRRGPDRRAHARRSGVHSRLRRAESPTATSTLGGPRGCPPPRHRAAREAPGRNQSVCTDRLACRRKPPMLHLLPRAH